MEEEKVSLKLGHNFLYGRQFEQAREQLRLLLINDKATAQIDGNRVWRDPEHPEDDFVYRVNIKEF
jgi:hypothetical protein